MPTPWTVSSIAHSSLGQGVYQVIVHPTGGRKTDITYFRNIPTQITSYTSADPFGSSTAVITMPQITILDDIGSGELAFLRDFADVTINLVWWPPGTTFSDAASWDANVLQGFVVPVWEGFIASFEFNQDSTSSSLAIQCQGACFQVDKIVAKPMFPPRPIPYEQLIGECFSHRRHPDLRLAPLQIEFPTGWDILAPNYANTPSYLTPVGVTPGEKITGYFSRATGAWDKALTSFVQGLLGVMYDDQGQQWTIRMDPGRKPVLYVRQMYNTTATYSVWAGQPGVQLSLTRDLTQYANVLYGQGTDTAGVEWDRQEVSHNGAETDYDPLAYDPEVYPPRDNPRYNPHKMVIEAYTKFDNGFDERQALTAAKQMLSRDMDPGLTGTLTLTIDPLSIPMGVAKAGDIVNVKGVLGTGSQGVNFHVSQAEHSPMQNNVTLTIDTKFRDLLTVEEVLARTRDPLTPVKMLQINKRTLLIEDQLAPWNYKKGSGFIPNHINFFKNITTEKFPYTTHSLRFPPKKHPHMYVKVRAHAKTRAERWTVVPIRMSEKGAIRLTQIAAFDEKGNVLKVPFHFSLYYHHISTDSMPYDGQGPSPFIPNAFESTNQFGEIINDGTPGALTLPDKSLIIGWGTRDQPAGYTPGSRAAGDPCTGLLIDEQSWTYDCTNNPDFDHGAAAGKREPESAITTYGIFYCEHKDYVFFRGRFFRTEPGTS